MILKLTVYLVSTFVDGGNKRKAKKPIIFFLSSYFSFILSLLTKSWELIFEGE